LRIAGKLQNPLVYRGSFCYYPKIMHLTIYTDGSCRPHNPGPGGWAFIILDEQNITTERYGGELDTTNNRMELYAVIAALESVIQTATIFDTFTVITDSQYVQQGISKWIKQWKHNGWKTGTKEPVKNQDLWQRLDKAAGQLNMAWQWVKGHAGNTYNERCDLLARTAINSL
jgi:ribonuclease HI